MRKISDKSQLRDILKITFKVLFRTIKAIKNKRNLRNCDSPEEPKETWQINVTWYLVWDPETEKGFWVKAKETWIKYEII